ncbi:TetR/AcrR family transcriptional regulator [Streptomyces lancefieldiae]|uniref:TetR/AcrR family transcriptional regulator n=1 Tax=Streptomyces lancefieldiae TaxID=3075520 RepID=A0ABU3APQ9_9ACTN|nr:TetR/AcrR family transcriptional regulator [Streptomyces sp. DSM 40712]MDT0611825.1 TetR/AcrR family transcriptional regulator [Streptomyces sp. DSM 40712]
MSSPDAGHAPPTVADTDRRTVVLDSAMVTFARFGYRKTSMEEVARAARISRPGLYFLFSSKEALFRAAVTQALERDITAVEHVLADTGRPLPERLVEAFDQWAGRYIGPLTRDVAAVIEGNPDLLGEIVDTAPRRFEELITDAIAVDSGREAAAPVAQTMISASIGLKHQAASREFYLERLEVAIDLLVR